ncbi:hypothetical protein [Cellvibrio sp. pealriver]|uniref:hypothetical protein n=1 Tax=Cellvibrio sp. pealriver TaxID=1622269 RepID=UPI00066FCCDB|nr:hypothetical protein [Cellvibrio sp. pealriver]
MNKGISKKGLKFSGYCFIASGCLFFLVAVSSGHVAFYGVGAALIAAGGAYLTKAKKVIEK